MANKLAYYLRRTSARDVNVNIDQVAELIGEEKAVELSLFAIKKSELRKNRVGPRSAIPAAKRLNIAHLAGFDRQQLLDAIEAVHGADFQRDGTETTDLPNAVPNAALLPEKQRRDLQARGLLSTSS